MRKPSGLAGEFPAIHTRYDKEVSALDPLRRVIWDAPDRQPVATIAAAQRRCLLLAIAELRGLEPAQRGQAIVTAPLLRRFGVPERDRVARLLDEMDAAAADCAEHLVDDAVAELPTLQSLVVLTQSMIDDPDGGNEVEQSSEQEQEQEQEQERRDPPPDDTTELEVDPVTPIFLYGVGVEEEEDAEEQEYLLEDVPPEQEV